MGSAGLRYVYVSKDGTGWHRAGNLGETRYAVAFGNGVFVATGWGRRSAATSWAPGIYTSSDGETWAFSAGPAESVLSNVTFVNGQFVAGGDQGRLYSSADGLRWTQWSLPSTGSIRSVAFGDGRWLVQLMNGVTPVTLVSADLATWSSVPSPRLSEARFHEGRFMGVGEDAVISQLPTSAAKDPTCGTRFSDVTGWLPACAAIEGLARSGVMSGYEDGTFQPERLVTRAEFAKMLTLARSLRPAPRTPTPFADAVGHWSASQGYVQAAVGAGAMSGFPDGTFRPDEPITRAQLVKAAAVVAGLRSVGLPPYDDVTASDWFSGWVAVAGDHKLIGAGAPMKVYTEDFFLGERSTTRAEAATVLANLMQRP